MAEQTLDTHKIMESRELPPPSPGTFRRMGIIVSMHIDRTSLSARPTVINLNCNALINDTFPLKWCSKGRMDAP